MINKLHLNSTGKDEKNQEVLEEGKLTGLKRASVKVAELLFSIDEKKGLRMMDCAKVLLFKNFEQIGYRKLFKAFVCKILLCPFCMTRKSILLGNNLFKVMKYGAEEHQFEYIHLVLAQRNCKITELESVIDDLLKAFKKFSNRDIFLQKGKGAKGIIKGWFRNLEITFNREEKTFHPHFHIILAVEKSYFSKEFNSEGYLTQEKALKMWRECLGVDYMPTAHLNKIYYLDENGNKVKEFDSNDDIALKKAVKEASKYITKALEILALKDEKLQKKVLKNMLKALSNRRLFAYGGELKKIKAKLKLEDEEKSNLINIGDEEIDTTDMEYLIEVYKWCQENNGQYKKYVEMSKKEYDRFEKFK